MQFAITCLTIQVVARRDRQKASPPDAARASTTQPNHSRPDASKCILDVEREVGAQKGCVRRSMDELVQALRSFRDTTFPNGFGAKQERRDQAAAIGAGSSVAFFAAVILSVLSRRDEQSTVLRPSAISHPTPRPSGQRRGSSNRDSIHDVILTQRTQVVARVIVPLACERVG